MHLQLPLAATTSAAAACNGLQTPHGDPALQSSPARGFPRVLWLSRSRTASALRTTSAAAATDAALGAAAVAV